MIFNSLTFVLFFVILFLVYWIVAKKSKVMQNGMLLIASYVFYAWADWRFLAFLIGVSLFNFILGIQIEKRGEGKKRQLLVYLGIIQGVGGLVFFKYFNFFIDSFNDLFAALGIGFNLQSLNILIPLGISFFTFKTISYILDIDKGKIDATKDWLVFFNYVSFFPTILSGPIDKAKQFVPQLEKVREFQYSKISDGMRQILWGLFQKVVIADNFAVMTNNIFENYGDQSGSTLLLGAFVYSIQIYADFSGYSDMAIGLGRCLGFNVTRNFNFPFFAQNIADFWRKWHISLTSWLTEYLFTPLSIFFRDHDKLGVISAVLINFTIIGMWHGANWTYMLFGLIHGLYFIPLILNGTMNKKKKIAKDALLPTFKQFSNMLITFIMVMLTFVLFRSPTIGQAFDYFLSIFSGSLFSLPDYIGATKETVVILISILFIVAEWFGRNNQYAISNLGINWPKPLRYIMYATLVFLIGMYMQTEETPFIYIQF